MKKKSIKSVLTRREKKILYSSYLWTYIKQEFMEIYFYIHSNNKDVLKSTLAINNGMYLINNLRSVCDYLWVSPFSWDKVKTDNYKKVWSYFIKDIENQYREYLDNRSKK